MVQKWCLNDLRNSHVFILICLQILWNSAAIINSFYFLACASAIASSINFVRML